MCKPAGLESPDERLRRGAAKYWRLGTLELETSVGMSRPPCQAAV